MRKRCSNDCLEEEPPNKRRSKTPTLPSVDLKQGEILKDITSKQWKLGKPVGVGGFGEIYLASENTKDQKTNYGYIAKVERHESGPLFAEINCYLRAGKHEMIEEWKRKKKLENLGMPHYVASGSHWHKGNRYRFLILPRYDQDLENILKKNKILNLKTVLTISCQIVDVLEYIHKKGYIHSDIKASNILLNKSAKNQCIVEKCNKTPKPIRSCRIKRCIRTAMWNLRIKKPIKYFEDDDNLDICQPPEINESHNQIYLLDYGLAAKYVHSNGQHKEFSTDERKAHAGTVLFCSCDAHKGIQTRRSDLESLGYNMVYWLSGTLPWLNECDEPKIVAKRKTKFLAKPEELLKTCFIEYPKFLLEYFYKLKDMKYNEEPDYSYLKKLFKTALSNYGHKDDSVFDFNQIDNSVQKQKRINCENVKFRKVVGKVPRRPPLQSNIPIPPILRKSVKKEQNSMMNWSKILIDPEIILKQSRKNSEPVESNNIANLDIYCLNPTSAMLEIYRKNKKNNLPNNQGDFKVYLDGYTPAMMAVYQRMKQKRQLELCQLVVHLGNTRIKRNKLPRRDKPVSNTSLQRKNTNTIVSKKDIRKVKSVSVLRSYSLRG